MLNLLILDCDYSYMHFKNYDYLWHEIKKLTNCVVLTNIHEAQHNLVELVNHCPFKPDFILINEMHNQGWKMKNCHKIDIPIGFMIHDIEASTFEQERKKFLSENRNIHLIFSIIKHSFLRTYHEFSHKLCWLPHHVNTEIFKDYHFTKNIDALLIGRVTNYYPLREKVIQKMNDNHSFIYYVHPDQRNYPSTPSNATVSNLVGVPYAQKINQAKMFFTCCSILQYPLLKYFEVLSSRTLLLANSCPELEELGFIPNVHFVEVSERNFYEKYVYYLNNELERNQIATQGYNFIREHHSTQIRAQQLVNYITDFLQR